MGRTTPAYRCGGSRGFRAKGRQNLPTARGTAFPFHPPRKEPAADTCWDQL